MEMVPMKIAVIDDYQNAFRTLRCYGKLKDHQVIVYNDTEKDPVRLAERVATHPLRGAAVEGRTLAIDSRHRHSRQDARDICVRSHRFIAPSGLVTLLD